ncbi:tyrosine--tRNA ligase, partial [candidate division WWE3 bacterium RIFOXYA2_FULL_46_9]
MGKVLTDEKLIDLFLTRGVEAVYPTTELLRQKLMSGARIRVYQGFDPTGPYLHVGHAMGIRAMSILQKLGHEVIFLVGDFTARVGDPDKDKTRDFLTAEQVEHNMNEWKKQAAQLIDFDGENPVQFKHNFDWLSQLKLENIIELMSMTTVQQMMERDLFAKRLQAKEPIQLREFIYPLLQGFDAVNMEVDLQMGGTDQTFNMLFGRDMV